MNIEKKALDFLYRWVEEGKIAHIRKGMVRELESLLNVAISDYEADKIASKMSMQQAMEVKESQSEKDPKQS